MINGFKKIDSIKKGNFWYNDGNEKYLFRSCILEELVYIELIMEEIFKEFNIDCVHYEPAMSNEDYGVTCKSFINPKVNYIGMTELMLNYLYTVDEDNLDTFLISSDNIKEEIKECIESLEKSKNKKVSYNISRLITNHYTLHNVICAIELKYGAGTEKSKLLIDEIKNLFEIDMLVANSDRNITNIIIEDGFQPKLSPIFDNEYSFRDGVINGGMRIDSNVSIISLNAEEYVNRYENNMDEKIHFLTPNKLIEIFNKVENERHIIIPGSIKSKIYTDYSKHWSRLAHAISNNKRLI